MVSLLRSWPLSQTPGLGTRLTHHLRPVAKCNWKLGMGTRLLQLGVGMRLLYIIWWQCDCMKSSILSLPLSKDGGRSLWYERFAQFYLQEHIAPCLHIGTPLTLHLSSLPTSLLVWSYNTGVGQSGSRGGSFPSWCLLSCC